MSLSRSFEHLKLRDVKIFTNLHSKCLFNQTYALYGTYNETILDKDQNGCIQSIYFFSEMLFNISILILDLNLD